MDKVSKLGLSGLNEASFTAYKYEYECPWNANTSHFCVIVHIRVERYSKRNSTGAKSPAWYACYGWGKEVILITQTARDGCSMFLLHNPKCHYINIQFAIIILFPNWNDNVINITIHAWFSYDKLMGITRWFSLQRSIVYCSAITMHLFSTRCSGFLFSSEELKLQ